MSCNIYEFREKFRELYAHDVSMNGDLGGAILDLMDDKIKSIDLKIDQNSIEIVGQDNCTESDLIEIDNKVRSIVSDYILNNIDNIDIPEESKKDAEAFATNTRMICDSFIANKIIKFSL